MSDIVFTSALGGRSVEAGQDGIALSMGEIGGRGMIDLRGLTSDKAFLKAAKSVLGVDLPLEPRSSASSGDITVLWLSVDQWLVTLPRSRTAELLSALGEAVSGLFAAVTDMSDARTIIRLEGDGARQTLMKASSVDLTVAGIDAGFVRRILFAEIAALVHIVSTGPDVVDLYVFRSYGEFAWEWLTRTATQASAVPLFAPQAAPAV